MFVSVDLPRVTQVPGVRLVVELVEEQGGVRVVADRDEDAVGLEHGLLAGDRVRSRTPVTLPVAEHLLDDLVEHELDLLVRAARGRP